MEPSFPLFSYFDNTAIFTLTLHRYTLLLCLSPFVLLYILYRALRVGNRVERRIRYFTDVATANPVLSHRGGYPENTLTGIRLSKKRGFKAVEIDVEYTKDDYAVLLHDPTVDRTSNGTGHVRDMTFAQIRELDFGVKFGPQYAGERVPTLQEALALCKELDLIAFVEVKSNRLLTLDRITLAGAHEPAEGSMAYSCQFFTDYIASVVSSTLHGFLDSPQSAKLLKEICSRDQELYNHIVVVSFYPDLIYLVARADPNIVVALAMKNWEFTYNMDGSLRHDRCWRQMLAPFFDIIVTFINHHVIWRLIELPFVGLYKGDLTDERLQFWRRRGAAVIVWTMTENEAQEFQKKLKVPVIVDVLPS